MNANTQESVPFGKLKLAEKFQTTDGTQYLRESSGRIRNAHKLKMSKAEKKALKKARTKILAE